MAWGRQNKSKYWANKATYKGIEFDSKHEMRRYIYLCDRLKKGEISDLKLQKEFVLLPATTKLVPVQLKTKVRYDKKVVEQDARYTCDFLYKENGCIVMEEFKSEQTAKLPDYILRRKLMIKKIYKHNERNGRTKWIFREVIYYFDKNKPTTIEDK